MAFQRSMERKGLSLPGLIDIIFLLLIFSLVTLSVSQAKVDAKKRSDQPVEFNLPETKVSETVETADILYTLMFQVEPEDPQNTASARVVYVLWPSAEDSVTIAEAKVTAKQDSLFQPFPEQFLSLNDDAFVRTPACTLIHWAVKSYMHQNFREPSPTNAIEVRAEKNTEFRIINYIMETCSAYGDTIPRFTMRTLSGKEAPGGI